eukprot:3977995-Prymnesium_polylepis.2
MWCGAAKPHADHEPPPACGGSPPAPLALPCRARVITSTRPMSSAVATCAGAPCGSPDGWSPRTPMWCGATAPHADVAPPPTHAGSHVVMMSARLDQPAATPTFGIVDSRRSPASSTPVV